MKTLKGWNSFYEGWLARVLLKDGDGHHKPPLIETSRDALDYPPHDRQAWLLGWKTADESYSVGIGDVLLMEIDKGHILVE